MAQHTVNDGPETFASLPELNGSNNELGDQPFITTGGGETSAEKGHKSGGIRAGNQSKQRTAKEIANDSFAKRVEESASLPLRSEAEHLSWDNSIRSDCNESIDTTSKQRPTEVSRILEMKQGSADMIVASINSSDNNRGAHMVARLSDIPEEQKGVQVDASMQVSSTLSQEAIKQAQQKQAVDSDECNCGDNNQKQQTASKRTKVISVTNIGGPPTQAQSQRQSPEAPKKIMDKLTKKTVRKGNTAINAISNKLWVTSEQANQRRRRDNTNSDLKQVEEVSPRREMGTQKSTSSKLQQQSQVDRNKPESVTNDEERTLTPHSQMFIFQAQFRDNSKMRNGGTLSPTTLPANDTSLGHSPLSLLQKQKIEVRNIEVGNGRRISQIDTEMGSQIAHHQSVDNTVSQMQVRQGGADNEAIMGTILRQSQSGHHLSPEKKNEKTLIVPKDELQMNSYQEPTKKPSSILDENKKTGAQPGQEAGMDDVGKDLGNKDNCPSDDVASETVVTRPSAMQTIEEKKDISLYEATPPPEPAEPIEKRRKNNLLDGLSAEERLEIQQTMKIVYPNLAIASVKSNRNKTIQFDRPKMKLFESGKPSHKVVSSSGSRYPKNRTKMRKHSEAVSSPISPQKQASKYGALIPSFTITNERTFLQSQKQPYRTPGSQAAALIEADASAEQPKFAPINPRQMIFSQHVPQRTLLQLTKEQETGKYGHISKKPQMNRGFLQNNSVHSDPEEQYPVLSSAATSKNFTESKTTVGGKNLNSGRSVPCSQHNNRGSAIKILDLPNILPESNNCASDEDRNSLEATTGAADRDDNLHIDPALFEELQKNVALMQAQDAVIGMKKQIFERQSGLSTHNKQRGSNLSAGKHKSDMNVNRVANTAARYGPQWKIDDRHYFNQKSPKYSFDMNCFTTRANGDHNRRKQSSNLGQDISYLIQQNPSQGPESKPASTQNNSRFSYMQRETPIKKVNIVSSGEVSLTTRSYQLGGGQQPNGKMVDSKRGGLQFKALQTRQHQIQIGTNMYERTSQKDAMSPSKVSMTAESQLTTLSQEGYIRKPKMVSQLDQKRQQMNAIGSPKRQQRSKNTSPDIWKPNMRTIAEGRAANNQTLNSNLVMSNATGTFHNSVINLEASNPFTTQANQSETKKGQGGMSSASAHPQRTASQDGSRLPRSISNRQGGDKVMDELQVPEADLKGVDATSNSDSIVGGGVIQESKTTKYLNLQSHMALKHQNLQIKIDMDKSGQNSLKLEQSQNSLNKDLSQARVLTLNNSQPPAVEKENTNNAEDGPDNNPEKEKVVLKPTKLNTTGSDIRVKEHNIDEGNMAGFPFKITGKKLGLSIANIDTDKVKSQNTFSEIKDAPMASNNLLKVKVQSTSPLLDCKSNENTVLLAGEPASGEGSPQTVTHKGRNLGSFPQLFANEGQNTQHAQPQQQHQGQMTEPISARIWGRVINTTRGRMVSPQIKVNKSKGQKDFSTLKIAPTTSYGRKYKTLDNSVTRESSNGGHVCKMQGMSVPRTGARLRDFLVQECANQLQEAEELGLFKTEDRQGARLISSDQIAKFNYSKQQTRHNSIQVLEGTSPMVRSRNLEGGNEDHQLTDISIKTGDKQQVRDLSKESHYNKKSQLAESTSTYHYNPQRLHSQSLPSRDPIEEETAIGSDGQKSLNSVERLQTFYINEQKNQRQKQPYHKPDCKYIMKSTGQTLRKNMERFYGMQPALVDKRSSPKARYNSHHQDHRQHTNHGRHLTSDHGFELKKVPLQRKEDGYLLSNFASPEESAFAKRKLMSQQRKEHALKIQNENQQRHLEMSYQVSSPAAKMRTLIFAQQKKKNAMAKSTNTKNPVLYQDMDAMKTWQMC